MDWAVSVEHLLHFGVYLKEQGLAVSTIRGHFVALAFDSKMLGYVDHSSDFRVLKMMESWPLEEGPRKDTRQPLSPVVLKGLHGLCRSVCVSPSEVFFFHAAALIALFGALRVGELVVSSMGDMAGRALTFQDVQM